MTNVEYCDKCRVARATHSYDNIPFEYEDEILPVGELLFCDHHSRMYENVAAAHGYTINKLEVQTYNESRLQGSAN